MAIDFHATANRNTYATRQADDGWQAAMRRLVESWTIGDNRASTIKYNNELGSSSGSPSARLPMKRNKVPADSTLSLPIVSTK